MSKRFLSIIFTLVFFGTGSGLAHAQSNEGALAGTILDPSGNVVAGAAVAAVNSATGQSFRTIATPTGNYHFPVLAVGTYNITATAPGFKTAQRTGVAVQIQSTTSLDIQLTLGAASETVEVNCNRAAVADRELRCRHGRYAQAGARSSAVNQWRGHPQLSRFCLPDPGYLWHGTNGGTFEGGVSGGQAFGSEIMFDGASLQVKSFGDGFANEILPSVEATGEFKVLVGGIPAQYGRTTGGVQSYGSKSGRNSFHGGVF